MKEALRGLRSIYHSKPPKLVPLREMVDAVSVPKTAAKPLGALRCAVLPWCTLPLRSVFALLLPVLLSGIASCTWPGMRSPAFRLAAGMGGTSSGRAGMCGCQGCLPTASANAVGTAAPRPAANAALCAAPAVPAAPTLQRCCCRRWPRCADVGAWVRPKGGMYKHDLAKVVDVNPGEGKATIRWAAGLRKQEAGGGRRREGERAGWGAGGGSLGRVALPYARARLARCMFACALCWLLAGSRQRLWLRLSPQHHGAYYPPALPPAQAGAAAGPGSHCRPAAGRGARQLWEAAQDQAGGAALQPGRGGRPGRGGAGGACNGRAVGRSQRDGTDAQELLEHVVPSRASQHARPCAHAQSQATLYQPSPPSPAARPPQARGHKLEVVQQRDRSTGEVFYILNGSQRFVEGYLQRTVAIKGLLVRAGRDTGGRPGGFWGVPARANPVCAAGHQRTAGAGR